MIAPIDTYGAMTAAQSVLIALGLGFAFGFFLERAGFGNARKLVAVFYLYDMAVLKVMFTAIVTAMVGLWALSAAGILDLSEIYIVPTYLVPQFVGGLLLGVGFVVGGYCPGTSVAGMATGRLDALAFGGGLLGGLAAYAEIQPSIESWTETTGLGKVTLPEILGIPRGVLTVIVVVFALVVFYFLPRLEAAFARNRPVGGAG